MLKQIGQFLGLLTSAMDSAEDVMQSANAGTRVMRKNVTAWEERETKKLEAQNAIANEEADAQIAEIKAKREAKEAEKQTSESKEAA